MATQQLGAAGMTAEARAFYDKVLLSRTIPNFVHRNFGPATIGSDGRREILSNKIGKATAL